MPSLRRPSQKTITSEFPLTVRVFQLLVVLFTQTPDEGSLWQAVTLICTEAESRGNNVHRAMHSATGWLNMLHPVVLHYNDLQNLCQLHNLFIMQRGWWWWCMCLLFRAMPLLATRGSACNLREPGKRGTTKSFPFTKKKKGEQINIGVEKCSKK